MNQGQPFKMISFILFCLNKLIASFFSLNLFFIFQNVILSSCKYLVQLMFEVFILDFSQLLIQKKLKASIMLYNSKQI